jgi:CDP-alcohol phosphatidyltransferase
LQIETALIAAPSRANNRIFGRPLLERLLISCQRAGIRKFIIQTPGERRGDLDSALGGFKSHPDVAVVDNFDDAALRSSGVDTGASAIAFSGNLVFQKSYLARILDEVRENPGGVFRITSADSDRGGEIMAGPIAKILESGGMNAAPARPAIGDLPFALNGRPEDREEAELRLARSLHKETVHTDAPMARLLDRKISWRISYRLARTRIRPNQVTIANTLLGFFCAFLFATPNYGARLLGALLFVVSITIDGVDGELARLKMSETEFGGKLDVITDNIVHIAIFVGIFTGVYRARYVSVPDGGAAWRLRARGTGHLPGLQQSRVERPAMDRRGRPMERAGFCLFARRLRPAKPAGLVLLGDGVWYLRIRDCPVMAECPAAARQYRQRRSRGRVGIAAEDK